MPHRTAFVFPGQGSQFAGMGKDIADAFPAARQLFEEVDEALGFGLSRLCFEGPEEELKLTRNTQPAILTVSAAIDRVLQEESGLRAGILAGHSLGEYSAIVSGGGLTPSEGASIVQQRGAFMQDAVAVGAGAMAAILGPSLEEIQSICDEASEGEVVSPANINAPGQIVIAGTKSAVQRAMDIAKKRGVRKSLLLPVSAPFHCALMKPSEEKLRAVLDAAPFQTLRVPVVSNVDAAPVATDGAIRNALLRQVCSPVRWVESVQKMIGMGVIRFIEVGPGSVLTGLIKRIDPTVELITINNAESLRAAIDQDPVEK